MFEIISFFYDNHLFSPCCTEQPCLLSSALLTPDLWITPKPSSLMASKLLPVLLDIHQGTEEHVCTEYSAANTRSHPAASSCLWIYLFASFSMTTHSNVAHHQVFYRMFWLCLSLGPRGKLMTCSHGNSGCKTHRGKGVVCKCGHGSGKLTGLELGTAGSALSV